MVLQVPRERHRQWARLYFSLCCRSELRQGSDRLHWEKPIQPMHIVVKGTFKSIAPIKSTRGWGSPRHRERDCTFTWCFNCSNLQTFSLVLASSKEYLLHSQSRKIPTILEKKGVGD